MEPDIILQWMLLGWGGIMMFICIYCFIMAIITLHKAGKRK